MDGKISTLNLSKIKIIERYLFFAICFAFCTPILFSYRFITLDGPAHLYNSKIIFQLLFHSESIINNFFTFNNFPNPNYFYHGLATFLFLFFNDIWVEKLIAIAYVFLFCYGFRQIIKNQNTTIFFSYLIFPFVYSFTFLIGFYNFSFSIAFLFWFIALIAQANFSFSKKSFFTFFSFYITLYFSHIMVFFIALLIAFSFLLIDVIKRKKNSLKKCFLFITPAIPFLLMSFWFVFSHKNYETPQHLNFNELKNWLIDGRDIIGRDYSRELFYTRAINYLVGGLFIFNGLIFFFAQQKQGCFLFSKSTLFFLAIIFSLFLFFKLPNNLFSGGYLSVRLLLFFHLFILLFFAFLRSTNKVINIAFVSCILIFSIALLSVIFKQSFQLGKDYKDYAEVSVFIKEQSTVLPIDYSKNWINSNYGCYLGADKNIVVLDNYEASTVHFPLVWKNNKLNPNKYMPDYGITYNPSLNINNYEKKTSIKIDYVVRWKYNEADKTDSNNLFTNAILNKYFVKIFESSNKKAELFKHKI